MGLGEEDGTDVFLVDVLGNILGYGCFVFFKGVEVAVAYLGGYFVTDVEELAKVGVIAVFGGVVAQGCSEALAIPFVDLGRGWEPDLVNVDDGGIGSSELVVMGMGLLIDFFGQR